MKMNLSSHGLLSLVTLAAVSQPLQAQQQGYYQQAPGYPQQYPPQQYRQPAPSYQPPTQQYPQSNYVSPMQFLPTFGRKFGDMFRRVFYGDAPPAVSAADATSGSTTRRLLPAAKQPAVPERSPTRTKLSATLRDTTTATLNSSRDASYQPDEFRHLEFSSNDEEKLDLKHPKSFQPFLQIHSTCHYTRVHETSPRRGTAAEFSHGFAALSPAWLEAKCQFE
jgi:hypothetical protein